MQDWEPPGIEHFIAPTNPAQHTQQAAHQVGDLNTQRPTDKGLEDHQIITKLEDKLEVWWDECNVLTP